MNTQAVSHLTPTAAPPTLLAEQRWRIPGTVPAADGVEFTASLSLPPTAEAAEVFEAFADRFDLLER